MMLRGKPCAPKEPFPWLHHRSMASVDRSASAPDREARAQDLNQRREAIGWSIAHLARVAGIYDTNCGNYMRGKKRASWPTLDLIDQALQRGERKAGVA